MRVSLRFEPRDIWVGVYWDRTRWQGNTIFNIFICLIPLFPIHVRWAQYARK